MTDQSPPYQLIHTISPNSGQLESIQTLKQNSVQFAHNAHVGGWNAEKLRYCAQNDVIKAQGKMHLPQGLNKANGYTSNQLSSAKNVNSKVNPNADHCQVVVGIATFRRPIGLANLLDSLAKLESQNSLRILVAENDSKRKQGSLQVKKTVNNGYPFEISVLLVPERGISQARNALMEAAFDTCHADFLAMVDDDETVDRNWLNELLETQARYRADIVAGHVIAHFPDGEPRWVENIELYHPYVHKEGLIELVESTANVLIGSRIHKELGQRFDESYSLTGGGDKEFFARVKTMGARFAYTPRAKTYESFGASRVTRQWASMRALRIGSSDMRITLTHNVSKSKMWIEVVKIPIAMVASLILMFTFIWIDDRKYMRARVLFFRQFGKLRALFGLKYEAYKTIHGD